MKKLAESFSCNGETGKKYDYLPDMETGTSIFDPVLCELVYRWFSPEGGTVVDPFAGGSVRGIVAGKLGRKYIGLDLRGEQIEANKEQANSIFTNEIKDTVKIKISSKWANNLFNCSYDNIINNCIGRCCEGTDKILISILPEEEKGQIEAGYEIKEGLLQPDKKTGKCPHKLKNGLCGVHETELKPFGCIASPFTLNNSNTLIIRNRYSMMKCHGEGEPAFKTFRASLDKILGNEESERVCQLLESGSRDIIAEIPIKNYENIKYLDGLKSGNTIINGEILPIWHTSDSRNIDKVCQGVKADLIFSCPPYADLEVYSDNPQDLSTLAYPDFIESYREIIKKSCSLLKENAFACFVVGEVRDKKGNYYNFVGDTIKAFIDAGLNYYNEAILVTAIGSLPIRVGKQFKAGRKIGKTHQNILMFVKGDGKKATKNCGVIEIEDLFHEEEE